MSLDGQIDFSAWYAGQDPALKQDSKPLSFIEITRVPKDIDARALASMVVTASKIMPKSVQICYRGPDLEVIGLVEYKTSMEAHRAAEKIRASLFGKPWNVRLTEEPEYKSPENELANKLAASRQQETSQETSHHDAM